VSSVIRDEVSVRRPPRTAAARSCLLLRGT
jgi:hypothetical protein